MENAEFRKIFAPNGTLLVEGQRCRRPQLAKTLKAVAEHGADAFYKV